MVKRELNEHERKILALCKAFRKVDHLGKKSLIRSRIERLTEAILPNGENR